MSPPPPRKGAEDDRAEAARLRGPDLGGIAVLAVMNYAAGDLASGHAEVDDRAAGADLVHLGELVPGGREADFESVDVAGPAFAACFADAGDQVVADLGEPLALGRVGTQQRAADAPLTEPTERPSGLLPRSAGGDSATSSCPVRTCR
jgi:hypothetical protein